MTRPAFSRPVLALASAFAAAATAAPALAHHPMGGQIPQTFAHGFLSGIGHPVIGLDHFAFVVGVGLLSLFCARRYLMPGAFVAATMAGTGLHLASVSLPFVEIAIAASVMIAGILLVLRTDLRAGALAALFAAAGIFHGFAYGEAVFGAEPTPVFAYLLGFGLIQYGIAVAAMEAARRLFAEDALRQTWLRVGGGAIAGVAFVFLAGHLSPF
jgi:urease accessory protein